MFSLIKQILDHQNSLYIVKRILRESSIDENYVQEYKKYLHADTVLKKNGIYYFVNKIDEVQIVEEEGQLELDF